jgi:thioredoxin reductase (NADPH)
MDDFDIVVVGAGPAGLTAGLYAARSGMRTAIYEQAYPGGLASVTASIDNYPGFPEGIPGMELGVKMYEQAKRFGAILINSRIERLWRDGGTVLAQSGGHTTTPKAAVIATGSTPRKLGAPGEAALIGKGVSYCATCDGPLYRGRTVAVVGGGDSALQEALFLTRFASKVVLIHRRKAFRAALVLQDDVRANAKISLALGKVLRSIKGKDMVEAIEIEDRQTAETEVIGVEGVFIYVGYDPNVAMLGPEFRRSEAGFLLADTKLETSVPGVFAAGDVREKALRQVATAVGDGALAAMSAYAYREGLNKLA